MIYDRPIWALMKDAAAELSPPYTVGEIVAWFAQHYPVYRSPAWDSGTQAAPVHRVAFSTGRIGDTSAGDDLASHDAAADCAPGKRVPAGEI